MSSEQIIWISPDDPQDYFPKVSQALDYPNGLLCAGGDLSPTRLLSAYHQGIFPWYSEQEPILWWTPSPRCVMFPDSMHISRSLKKKLKHHAFRITFDHAFDKVIASCSEPRPNQPDTWITDEMRDAYQEMHKLGWAHSVEVWDDNSLVGGLYGLSIERVFFGESMFSKVTNASKIALIFLARLLAQQNFVLIDCQVQSDHLETLGAISIPREDFCNILRQNARVEKSHPKLWNDINVS